MIAAREAREALEAGQNPDSVKTAAPTKRTSNTRAAKRSAKRSSKATKVKEHKPKQSGSSSGATRSVRRRK